MRGNPVNYWSIRPQVEGASSARQLTMASDQIRRCMRRRYTLPFAITGMVHTGWVASPICVLT